MDIYFSNTKPKYIELYNQICTMINNGVLKTDEKLPSKRNLAIDLNVSLNTIINAYDLLLEEGYIYTVEKKGYFVSSQPICMPAKKGLVVTSAPQIKFEYDFTTQNISSFTSIHYKRIVRDIIDSDLYINKTPFLGDLSLRDAISKHLSENRGINVSKEQILICSGMEIFDQILRVLPYDNVTLENPGYHKLKTIAKNNNIDVIYQDLDNDGVICPTNKSILYTTPFNQFPTGIKMSISRKKELVKWANDTNSIIIEDDFDAEFRINTAPTTSIYSLSPEHVIFFSTFTTTIYPGLRIAFAILPSSVIELYNNKYSKYSNTVPTLDQIALSQFISSGFYASHINKKKKEYLTIRNKCIEYLSNYKDIIDIASDKNYLSLLITIKKDIDMNNLAIKLKESKINIQSLSMFGNNYNSKTLILGYTAIKNDKLIAGLELIITTIKSL